MTRIFLLPGEIVVTAVPAEITTVLGSCVSVVLFDEWRTVAGVSHYLLPSSTVELGHSPRYADHALPYLHREMLKAGSRPHEIRAWVFGGANALGGTDMKQNVGDLNIRAAFKFLAEAGIPVRDSHVGGVGARKIRVDSENKIIDHEIAGERHRWNLRSMRGAHAR